MSFLFSTVLTQDNVTDQQTARTSAFIEVLTLADDLLIKGTWLAVPGCNPLNSYGRSNDILSFSHATSAICLRLYPINVMCRDNTWVYAVWWMSRAAKLQKWLPPRTSWQWLWVKLVCQSTFCTLAKLMILAASECQKFYCSTKTGCLCESHAKTMASSSGKNWFAETKTEVNSSPEGWEGCQSNN